MFEKSTKHFDKNYNTVELDLPSSTIVATTGRKTQHYIFLDGLRGVAALAVLFLHWLEGHGYQLFGSSLLAVDFFFMLSGFVVTHAYQKRLRAEGRGTLFLRQRLIRLYPVIVLGLLLGVVRFSVLSWQETGTFLTQKIALELFAGLLMIPMTLASAPDFFPLDNPLWSLHFEFIAYIAFWLFMFRSSSRTLAVIAVIAAAGCFLWARATFGADPVPFPSLDHVSGYINGLSRVAFSFTLGMLLYRGIERMGTVALPHGRWLALLLILPLILPRSYVPPLAVMVLLGLIFPYIIFAGSRVQQHHGLTRIEKFMGDVSYPLYALHVPLLWMMSGTMKKLGPGFTENPVWNGLFILPVTIAFSYAAFVLYDKPLRAWLGRRYAHRARITL
ncbi:MAG: acyltransferase family protein [Sphingomonadaceae bacterium]